MDNGFEFLFSTRCCSRHYCCFRMSLAAAVGFASKTGLMFFSNRDVGALEVFICFTSSRKGFSC